MAHRLGRQAACILRWSRRDVLAGAGSMAVGSLPAARARKAAAAPAGGAVQASRSLDPADYVQVRGGTLQLRGNPFFVKGINYFGSWRDQSTIDLGKGVEQTIIWGFFHHWDRAAVEADFQQLRSGLNATAVRVGTPAEGEFAHLVKYHGFPPWYNPDGSIAAVYLDKLAQLVDAAYSAGIHVQFCLLWNVQGEIARTPDSFWPKGSAEAKY